MSTEPKDKFQILIVPEGGPTELILADGALSETHGDATEYSQFPVGRGGFITDHRLQLPAELSVDLFFTDTPSRTPETNVPSGFAIETQIIDTPAGRVGSQGPNQKLERGRIVYERLLELQREGVLLTLLTSRRAYTNMVIVNLEVPVQGSERSTEFLIDFRQIEYANTSTTEIVVVPEPTLQAKKDGGNKDGKEDAPGTGRSRSMLRAGGDFLGSLLGGG